MGSYRGILKSVRRPNVPTRGTPLLIRIRGILHRELLPILAVLYRRYCNYRGLPYPSFDNPDVAALPFNTLVKWSPRVREEEALSLSFAYSLGLPVPRMISYGDDGSGSGGSIWMTRVSGEALSQLWSEMSNEDKTTIVNEIDECLVRLRQFRNPASPCISSISGTLIKSFRAPSGVILPCPDKLSFLEYLLSARDPALWAHDKAQFEADTAKVKRILELPHSIVFAHGDLFQHNILVKDGHVSGIIDWECAGWLPEYWDYTTMTVRGHSGSAKIDWNTAIHAAPGFRYAAELESEFTLFCATQYSFPL